MIYIVYFSDLGTPKTGLSPTLDLFIKVSDGTSAGTPPSVSELSGGFYKFTYSPTEDVGIRVDSNDATMADRDRYIPIEASPHDDDLDAAVSGVKTQTDKMNFTGTDIKATLNGEKVALSDTTEEQIDDIETDVELIKGIGFPEVKKLEFATGEKCFYGIIIHDGFLYAACATDPGKIVKVSLPDFRKISTLTFNAGENGPWGEICRVGDFLYVACDSGQVIKIDLNTFTEVVSLALSSSSITSILSHNGFLYVLNYDSPSVIIKVDVATFTEVDTLTLSSGENEVYCGCIADSKLYVGCYTTPSKVVKINLDSFTKEAVLTLSSGNNKVAGITAKAGYLYCGLTLDPGRVVKIDAATFTEVTTLILDSGEKHSVSLSTDEKYLFVGTETIPAKIIVIDLDSFTRLFSWVAESGYNALYRATAQSGNFLYGGCETDPGKLIGVPFSIWQHTNEMQDRIAFIKSVEGGRWKIISNQMIFYKEDNITEVARFNLLDKDGLPAEKNVMERTRV